MNNLNKSTKNYVFAKKITKFARSCITTLDRQQLLRLLAKIDIQIDTAYGKDSVENDKLK